MTTKNVTPETEKPRAKKAAPKARKAAPKAKKAPKGKPNTALIVKEARKTDAGKEALGLFRTIDKGIVSAFGAMRTLEAGWKDTYGPAFDGRSINDVAAEVLSEDSKQKVSQMVNAARNARLIGDIADNLSMRAYAAFGANVTKEQMVTIIERLMERGESITVANIRREVTGRVGSTSIRRNPAQALAAAVQAGETIPAADLLNALESVASYTNLGPKDMSEAVIRGLKAREARKAEAA